MSHYLVGLYLKNLIYIFKHKYYVFREGWKIGGIPIWGLIIHDWQKLTRAEFLPYALNFFGYWPDGKPAELKKFFKRAWLHHVRHGPHHWQYWILPGVDEHTVFDMPDRYRREMLADWRAASLTQSGVDDTPEYYKQNKDRIVLAPSTRRWVEQQIYGKVITDELR